MSKRGIKGGDSLGEDSGRGLRGRGRGRGSGRGKRVKERESLSQDSSEESERCLRRSGSSVHDFVVESCPKNLLIFSLGELADGLDILAQVRTVTFTEKDYDGPRRILQVCDMQPYDVLKAIDSIEKEDDTDGKKTYFIPNLTEFSKKLERYVQLEGGEEGKKGNRRRREGDGRSHTTFPMTKYVLSFVKYLCTNRKSILVRELGYLMEAKFLDKLPELELQSESESLVPSDLQSESLSLPSDLQSESESLSLPPLPKSSKKEKSARKQNLHNAVNRCVMNICLMLRCSRSSLNLGVEAKGLIAGSLTLEVGGHLVDLRKCDEFGYDGWLIPSRNIGNTVIGASEAKCIIVLEKECAFSILAQQKIWQQIPCIIVTGKGFPDNATLELIVKIQSVHSIPVFGFFDPNPHGFNIFVVYRFCSFNMAFNSSILAVKGMIWLGVTMTDIELLKLDHTPLLANDISRLHLVKNMAPVQLNEDWLNELNIMEVQKCKGQIEDLIKYGIDFFATYIWYKIQQHLIKEKVLVGPPLHEIQHLSDVSEVVTQVASSSVISEHSFATIDVSKEAAPDLSSLIISTNVREAKAPDTGSSVGDTPFITTDVGEEATSKCGYLPETTSQIIAIQGDGNRLFRALARADYLQRTNICPTGMYEQCLADFIRSKVVLELLERRDEVERLLIEYPSTQYSDFDSYIDYITRDRTRGGVPEIHMASHVLRRPIWVYRHDEEKGARVRTRITRGLLQVERVNPKLKHQWELKRINLGLF